MHSGKLIVLLLALAFSTSAAAGLTLKETEKLSDQAMKNFANEDFEAGYKLLRPHWPIPGVEIDGLINQTQQQWPLISNRFGASIGYELIKSSTAGESLRRMIYIHKFEKHFVTWVFVFYKAKDSWQINSVSFTDQILMPFSAH